MTRSSRLIQALPALAALNLLGFGQGGYGLAVPIALGVAWTVLRDISAKETRARLLAAAAAGAVAGAVRLALGDVQTSPIPPWLSLPLGGALAVVCAWSLVCGRRTFCWGAAWMMAVVTMPAVVRPGIPVSIAVLAAATLLAAAHESKLLQGALPVLGVVLFGALVGAGGLVIRSGLQASEGTLVTYLGGAIYRWYAPHLSSRFGDSVALPRRSSGDVSSEVVLEAAGAPPLLRSSALDRFDGSTWTMSSELRQPAGRLPGGGDAKASLFFLGDPGPRLPARGTRSVSGATVAVVGGRGLETLEPLRGREVGIAWELGNQLLPEPPPARSLLELPPGLGEEIAVLASAATVGSRTAREKAEALQAHFRDGFEYSLEADLAGRGHPLAVLMRDRRPAYCTYFASAMAVSLRSLGVPARLAVGWATEGTNSLTGRAVARRRDAHAWVEAWIPEEGRFVSFDPTPWRSRDAALGVDRNPGTWSTLAEAVLVIALRIVAAPGAALGSALRSPVTWVLAAALAAWVFRLRLRFERVGRVRSAQAGGDAALRRAYRRYQAALRRRGVDARAFESDEEILARAAIAIGSRLAGSARRFLSLYRPARYGSADPAPALRAIEDLEAELRQ